MKASELSIYGEPEEGLGDHKAVLIHDIDNPSGLADAWWVYGDRLILVQLAQGEETHVRYLKDAVLVITDSPLSIPLLKRTLDMIKAEWDSVRS